MSNRESAPLRVLVTGGAGFIGANLVRHLLANDCRVTVFDDLSVGSSDALDGLEVTLQVGDILDAAAVVQAVGGHGAVVHLAAQTSVPESVAEPLRDFELNVRGTLHVLEACRRCGIERFVYASSNAVLGRQPSPAGEGKATLPISPYGASKLAGEAYCLAYAGSYDMKTVALRFANAYGPHCGGRPGVIARFFEDILAGRPLTIDGGGLQTRDFVYVEDLCRAMWCALEADLGGEIFQIATGEETSIRGLATLIGETVGRPVRLEHGPARHGDIAEDVSAIDKAERVLGWRPQIDLAAGLRETWNWYQSGSPSGD